METTMLFRIQGLGSWNVDSGITKVLYEIWSKLRVSPLISNINKTPLYNPLSAPFKEF